MRLSYANVTATMALVLAIGGGTVYAAGKLDSDDISRNAVQGKHVDKNALTGKDVKESKLGSVPAADSVGGVVISSFNETQRFCWR